MTRIVRFEKPNLPRLLAQGYSAVDMHYHTDHSDGAPSIRDVLKHAWKRGCGVAITDHNTVSGVREAIDADTGVMIVPGIEVSSSDGPHILLYFYTIEDLEHFYRRHIHDNKRKSPYLATYLDSEAIIERSREYECLRSAAHPYGYLMFNKGVQRCIDRNYLHPSFIEEFDAIEIICGGMSRDLNMKAVELSEENRMGRTAGTDGHLLNDLGTVVTCSKSQDVDGFLQDIIKRRNIVVGKEKGALAKGATGAALMAKYIPYVVPSLQIHYEQNIFRPAHAYRRWRYSKDRRE